MSKSKKDFFSLSRLLTSCGIQEQPQCMNELGKVVRIKCVGQNHNVEEWLQQARELKVFLAENEYQRFAEILYAATELYLQSLDENEKMASSFHFRNFLSAVNNHLNYPLFIFQEIESAYCSFFNVAIKRDENMDSFMREFLALLLGSQIEYRRLIRSIFEKLPRSGLVARHRRD